MGVGSPEPFGSDTACDWSYELPDGAGFAAIETAQDAVLATDDAWKLELEKLLLAISGQ